MAHKQDNQEVMHTIEMQIPAADAAGLADAMTAVGDFLHNYSDTLRGEDTDTEEDKEQEETGKPAPAAPAEEPRKAIRIELPRDDNGKLSEAFRNAAHFLCAASCFVGGDDKLAREELREIENAPAAETLKPKNRQEEMAEEGKEPVNLLKWKGGGGTLARGEVYAIIGKPKSGALALGEHFLAVSLAAGEFCGFSGSGSPGALFLAGSDYDEANNARCNIEELGEEYFSDFAFPTVYPLRGNPFKMEFVRGMMGQGGNDLAVIDGVEELTDITDKRTCVGFLRGLRELAGQTDSAVLITAPDYGGGSLMEALKEVCAEVFQIREEGGVFHVSIPAEGAPLEVFSFTREGKRGIPTIKEISAAGDLPF